MTTRSKKTNTPKKQAKKQAKPAAYKSEDLGEEFAIVETATNKQYALVPYKPIGAAHRELYRDRLTKAEAAKTAEKILKALNFLA